MSDRCPACGRVLDDESKMYLEEISKMLAEGASEMERRIAAGETISRGPGEARHAFKQAIVQAFRRRRRRQRRQVQKEDT